VGQIPQSLDDFEQFMTLNLRLAEGTIVKTMYRTRAFVKKWGNEFSDKTISNQLKSYLSKAPATYNTEILALKRLAKYLDLEDLLKSYKHAPVDIIPQYTPTTEEIRAGYNALSELKQKAIYLFLASTGIRKGELENLSMDKIDWANRCVKPDHFTRTKRSGITFFNQETEQIIQQYLAKREDDDQRLFVISDRQWKAMWNKVHQVTGVRITTKSLRRWQSVELGEKGTGDRYIDIFQGRAPRTTLAKHYTSHGIKRLKTVYDRAELAVLSVSINSQDRTVEPLVE
jgi:integrase